MSGVSEPKQQRSRDSFAKVRAAVLELLHERGTGQFSLAEVSARAGVSGPPPRTSKVSATRWACWRAAPRLTQKARNQG